MNQLFGPHRRNRRIRNAFLVVGIPAMILVAYFGFLKNDDNSNTIIVSEEEVNEEEIVEEIIEEVVDNSPTGILTRDYKWMIQSEDTRQLQELLVTDADGWDGEGTRTAHIAALEES